MAWRVRAFNGGATLARGGTNIGQPHREIAQATVRPTAPSRIDATAAALSREATATALSSLPGEVARRLMLGPQVRGRVGMLRLPHRNIREAEMPCPEQMDWPAHLTLQ